MYDNFEITKGKILKLTTGHSKTLEFSMDDYTYKPCMGVSFPSCRTNIQKRITELKKITFPVIYERGNKKTTKF